MLFEGTSEDDRNGTSSCYQNDPTIPDSTTTATTDTIPSSSATSSYPHRTVQSKKYNKKRSKAPVSLVIPKPWNSMVLTNMTSDDLHRYRSHYFHLPALSIYGIFPVATNTTTREMCELAERGFICMFHKVVPCRLLRINHSIHSFRECRSSSCNDNDHTTLPMRTTNDVWNLNEWAIQSILQQEMKHTTTTEAAAAAKADVRDVNSLSPPQLQPQIHHFLCIHVGLSKTTMTSYVVELDGSRHESERDAIITSYAFGQYTSLLQQFVNLQECTGALPLITKEDINVFIQSLQRERNRRKSTDNDEHHAYMEHTLKVTIPYFVTDNTKSAMISMTVRSHLLALHQAIKQWVYNIWDDVAATKIPKERPDVVVACCITGTEYDLIMQLLQFSPQHLLEHFCLVTDADLTWIPPAQNKIYVTTWSNVPSYIHDSTVLGQPEQFITVRRRRQNSHCGSNSTKEENRTNDTTTIPFMLDEEPEESNKNETSLQYEYITVALFKQKHFLHYGLQHLLYRYSQIRNKPFMFNDVDGTNDNDGQRQGKNDCDTNLVSSTVAAPLPTSPTTAEYIRQRLYGCRIAKYFGNDIYIGYVSSIESVESTSNGSNTLQTENMSSDIFTIQYDDGDEEEMNVHELYGELFLIPVDLL